MGYYVEYPTRYLHYLLFLKYFILKAYENFNAAVQDLLGRGNFSNVYKGIYTRPPDEKIVVAVKVS